MGVWLCHFMYPQTFHVVANKYSVCCDFIFYLCYVGMYTVMVAAMHRQAIAVDPILTNLALIKSSLEVADNTQYVSFVNNPIR